MPVATTIATVLVLLLCAVTCVVAFHMSRDREQWMTDPGHEVMELKDRVGQHLATFRDKVIRNVRGEAGSARVGQQPPSGEQVAQWHARMAKLRLLPPWDVSTPPRAKTSLIGNDDKSRFAVYVSHKAYDSTRPLERGTTTTVTFDPTPDCHLADLYFSDDDRPKPSAGRRQAAYALWNDSSVAEGVKVVTVVSGKPFVLRCVVHNKFSNVVAALCGDLGLSLKHKTWYLDPLRDVANVVVPCLQAMLDETPSFAGMVRFDVDHKQEGNTLVAHIVGNHQVSPQQPANDNEEEEEEKHELPQQQEEEEEKEEHNAMDEQD